MKTVFFYVVIIVLSLQAYSIEPANNSSQVKSKTGKIIVRISNFESDNGIVKLHLYSNSQPDDFPRKSSHALMRIDGKIKNKSGVYSFDNVPYGVYAFTVHHDENDNGKMDKTFLGLPAEGYGFSNSLKPLISVPGFEEAKFTLDKDLLEMNVDMNY